MTTGSSTCARKSHAEAATWWISLRRNVGGPGSSCGPRSSDTSALAASVTAFDVVALALVGGLILTMPVFAIISRNREIDPDVARRSRTLILGRWVRDWLMWIIGPIERGMIRAGVSPDALNYLGVVFGAAAGLAFAHRMLAAGGWLILLGGVADVFDGRVARARGVTNQYGAFADSTLD